MTKKSSGHISSSKDTQKKCIDYVLKWDVRAIEKTSVNIYGNSEKEIHIQKILTTEQITYDN